MFDVTSNVTSKKITSTNETANATRQTYGGYYSIDVKNNSASFEFSYGGKVKSIEFLFLNENTQVYENFYNSLYKEVIEKDTGYKYYEYCYWDTRYMKNNTITDSQGRIIGFTDQTSGDGE